ncbi:MAG: triacylglycerol esterase/lipase EstA (alpha/beta hydrolase family) [Alphaproteobacteria bacterium]|jgi:triacylglycerol esterase/lipase EstA (alpha/beta hydrolase family)
MINHRSLITVIFITMLLSLPYKAIGSLIDNENDNKYLVVFVSGLGGAKTWDSLKSLMSNDSSLKKFDVYVFDSLDKGGNIVQTSAALKRLIKSEQLSVYDELFIVAHSIGGIITKNYLLGRLETSNPSDMKEKHVLFIGTPHIRNTFTAPPIKKFFGNIFYFMLSDLAKDALNSTGIKSINTKWIDNVEGNQDKYIKNFALFGNDDKVVRPEDLINIFIGEYLVIQGTHLGIAQSKDEFDCTYLILKRKLLNPDSTVTDLGCSAD